MIAKELFWKWIVMSLISSSIAFSDAFVIGRFYYYPPIRCLNNIEKTNDNSIFQYRNKSSRNCCNFKLQSHIDKNSDHGLMDSINHHNTHLDRRNVMKQLALSTIVLPGVGFSLLSGKANAVSLKDVEVGGRWVPLKEVLLSESESSQVFEEISVEIPSYFGVYLSRILLNFDPAANEWWESKLNEYSLLPSSNIRYNLGRDFASFAASVQTGVEQFVCQSARQRALNDEVTSSDFEYLGKILIEKYKSTSTIQTLDIYRQVGFLMTLLPKELQPIPLLKSLQTKVQGRSTSSSVMLPVGFVENEKQLLTDEFTFIATENNHFQINPPIVLWEIGVGEEFDEAVGTVFGPRSFEPLQRSTPDIKFDVYKLLALSGAAACSLTHTVVIPLDVIKTRLQTNPGQYNGFIDGIQSIVRDEGPSALLLGSQATIAGFLWYGLSVYPCYDLFKRLMSQNLAPAFVTIHNNDIALIAGALASVVACIGLAPMEICRIRTVAQPEKYCPLGLKGTVESITSEDASVGWRALYAGFSSILTRQVIFGSIKFISFERASEAIFSLYPFLKDSTATSLAVSLVAGGLAGCLSSVVSQPADSVLTYCAKSSKNYNFVEGSIVMVNEDGIWSLFRGLGSRCIWAGSIIAGQFFLYSIFRELFQVTASDLTDQFQIFQS